jgi:hypothetical protein
MQTNKHNPHNNEIQYKGNTVQEKLIKQKLWGGSFDTIVINHAMGW